MKFTSTKHASYFPLSPCEENRMKIGWTLNVVIVEAALARDERKWYLEQARVKKWSKAILLKKLASAAHMEKPLDAEADTCYTDKETEDELPIC